MKITFEMPGATTLGYKTSPKDLELLSMFDWDSLGDNQISVSTAKDFKEYSTNLSRTLTGIIKQRISPEHHESANKILILLIHDYLMTEVCRKILISHIHQEADKLVSPEIKLELIELLAEYGETLR